MQHLRIVGTQEDDGSTLLVLSDDSGAEYALPVDGALRSAVGRPGARPAAPDDGGSLSPRDIQARLRAGASVEEVIEASGLDRAHVERYAGPVQAERAYFAQKARSTEVAPVSSAEQHRLAFGDAPASLDAMVKVRLRAVDVDLSTVVWDAWRREDGLWQVACWFDLSSSSPREAGAVGAQPPAEWTYNPAARQLTAQNAWAETLSALPQGGRTSRRSGRRLAPVDAPFDVEDSSRPSAPVRPVPSVPAEEQDTSPLPAGSPPAGETQESEGHEDLLDVLRARRGQRLGSDAEADDRLARMLTRQEEPEAQAPSSPQLRAVEDSREDAADDPSAGAETPDDQKTTGPEVPDADQSPAEQPIEDGTDAWGFSYEDAEESGTEAAGREPAPGTGAETRVGSGQPTLDEDTFGGSPEETSQRRPSQRRSKRSSSKKPSLPAWDDILFGGGKDS